MGKDKIRFEGFAWRELKGRVYRGGFVDKMSCHPPEHWIRVIDRQPKEVFWQDKLKKQVHNPEVVLHWGVREGFQAIPKRNLQEMEGVDHQGLEWEYSKRNFII